MNNYKLIGSFVLALIVGFVGYKLVTEIPGSHVQSAQEFSKKIDRQLNQLADKHSEFQRSHQSDEWLFLETYALNEVWDTKFEEAKKSLSEAKRINDEVVNPIIDRDHKEDVPALSKALEEGSRFLQLSSNAMHYPKKRADLLIGARNNKDEYFKNTLNIINTGNETAQDLLSKATKSTEDHPAKQVDIAGKVEKFREIVNERDVIFSVIKTEFESSSTKFDVYLDSHIKIQDVHKKLLDYASKNTVLLSQLDRSYVKVLVDQKVDYTVVIGRSSWCDGEYCGEGTTMRYPPAKVDENSFTYFDSGSPPIIARKSGGFFGKGFTLLVPNQRWTALGIDRNYRSNSSESEGEYWVEETKVSTFHKYSIIENGKVIEKNWQWIDETSFWKNFNNLGMAIESKPYGFYESELINAAEPVGMSTVATPTMVDGVPTGSNQYGEWRQGGGSSFFHYYIAYRMFNNFGYSRRYSYNDWNAYSTHGRSSAYYGNKNQHGTYGSATYSNSKYSKSAFAKRNPSAISDAKNLTRTNSTSRGSVRGAGPASRGKGPAGSGK